MARLYTEADYENSVIELFRNMGYSYLYGPDIERVFVILCMRKNLLLPYIV